MEGTHSGQLDSPALLQSIIVVRYAYPVILLLYFFGASLNTVFTLQTLSPKHKNPLVRRNVIIGLVIALFLEYLASAIVVLVRISTQHVEVDRDEIVSLFCLAIAWGTQILFLVETSFPVWYPYYISWIIGAVIEGYLVCATAISQRSKSHFDPIRFSLLCARFVTLGLLPYAFMWVRKAKDEDEIVDEERQTLLKNENGPKSSDGNCANAKDTASYGAASNNITQTGDESYVIKQQETAKRIEKRLKEDGNWWTYLSGFSILLRYIWPFHSKSLQFRAVLVGMILMIKNLLNILVPIQLGVLTDSLVGNDKKPWTQAAFYAGLVFINSDACISWIQYWLWLPLQQYAFDGLRTSAHAHIMDLSSDFHEDKSPAEIYKDIKMGDKISLLIEIVFFEVVPMLVDLVLVFAYLYILFGPFMALVPATTTILYIYCTAKLVSLEQLRRRTWIDAYRKEWMDAFATLGNWRIGIYHGNIPYEKQKYASSVKNYLKLQETFLNGTRYVKVGQGLIMTLGLLGCCFLAIYEVSNGNRTPGDFVVLISYWAQLRVPLSFLSHMYKNISAGLMDAERVLELLKLKPMIQDRKDATPLKFKTGQVSFNKVHFEYDSRKPTLKNVDFQVTGGCTVAIVGETGSGKSTILKLINRIYDVGSGSIEIDGQDIRSVTLTSLRKRIGVVPQDPGLFNDSVMNNVRYARLTASDQDVYDACKAASIHETIMQFPNGYNSKIGNQGLKISGGEAQRIAVARAILKRPDIILLDEATSSVDTATEHLIQDAFSNLCEGKTTFVVAHRLSTIIHADQIMVVKDGEIIEHGTHSELIHAQGKYHDLWSKQIQVEPAKSRSRSPKKGEVIIINDMEPNRRTVNLATAIRTTNHRHADGKVSPSKNATNGATSSSSSNFAKSQTDGCLDEPDGSRLKPDAPEFVPQYLRQSRDMSDYVSVTEEAGEEFPKDDPNCSSGIEETKKPLRGGSESEEVVFQDAALAVASSSRDEIDIGALDGSCNLENNVTEQIVDTTTDVVNDLLSAHREVYNIKQRYRRPRYGRRGLAKSEPAGDNMGESETAEMSSNEICPPLIDSNQAQRRVSAPSNSQPAAHDARTSTGRPRRSRPWKGKNRASGKSTSVASGPASSLDEGSRNAS